MPGEKISKPNRYAAILEEIFRRNYKEGEGEVSFGREEIAQVARKLKIELPKNLGDLIYTFRYRMDLPDSILKAAPAGKKWMIRPSGRSKYTFVAVATTSILPSELLAETKVPGATPGLIELYALSDEQALLAKLRYNRLIDIFTGVTCYSLQSHLRTTTPELGQVETDEVYVGVDKRGAHYVIPVQAKGGRDKLSVVQIEQDFAMCAHKFPSLICRPIAAQFMGPDLIALFAFEKDEAGVGVAMEKHYRLVPAEGMTAEDIAAYRVRVEE
jgi:hypothetical protein